ncbi:YtpR family tRNA-binding protein [Geobacillus stearothermophilus]|uniref:YtpR family tRNA-binding protein n=1 Tax=Geobacillus stearothermophilus TaxID=1422 RepID=UPI003D1DC390
MNVFYNREGIGDVLLVSLKPIPAEERAFVKRGDVVRIFSERSGETVGYNIFSASSYHPFSGSGPLDVDEELVGVINDILAKNGFDEPIEVDLSPKFVVGYVKEKTKHPNADKLSVCQVDVGGEVLQIVCGAPNVAAGQKVVVAKIGAVMPSGLVIQESELRGVRSSGMICSARELGLPNAPQEKGILVLSDEYEVGQPFVF